jgi:hypothetical protein
MKTMGMQRKLAVLLACAPALAFAQGGTETRLFVVDAGASDVHWRVYKAGAFARFGHNHVIAVSGLTGSIELAADGDADWTLSFDVDDLVVDNPALRGRYGEEFASEPTDDDIAGTKRNMLSDTVLNGAENGTIRLTGSAYTGSLENAQLSVVVEMLGRSIALTLPGSISVEGENLIAEGEFSLQHADLGMEPFSVMMGALQVAPQLDFSYRIHAVARDR